MRRVGARREYHHVQPIFDQTQRLKSAFTVALLRSSTMRALTHSNPAAKSNEIPRSRRFFSLLAESKLTSIFYCIYVYTITQECPRPALNRHGRLRGVRCDGTLSAIYLTLNLMKSSR